MSVASLRRVLLLGASGFIGRRLLAALQSAGYQVVCGVRPGTRLPGQRTVEVDYTRDHRVVHWLPRLEGVDAVINAVGILRESGSRTFEALHVEAPAALFRACEQAGVRKIIQISALGSDLRARSRYHVSKKRGDDRLLPVTVPWVVVQPSLVYGEGGASAALFAGLASMPIVPLPGDGGQHVQPIHIDDLCAAILALLETRAHDRRRVAAVGPRPITLRGFLDALRVSMGLGRATFISVPMPLVRMAATVGEHLPGVLLDREALGMLLRGNVASPARITAILGSPPRAADVFVPPAARDAVATSARLTWLLPLMRWSVALVWIWTAIVSFGLYPVADSYRLLAQVGLTGAPAGVALYGAATLDLAFGLGIFLLRDRRWLWRAQMALIVTYSAIIAVALPEQWLHPFGPIVKNLPLLAAIFTLHELERR